jgi:hypothetical protein
MAGIAVPGSTDIAGLSLAVLWCSMLCELHATCQIVNMQLASVIHIARSALEAIPAVT